MQVLLTREPLSLDAAYAAVRATELGGIVVFSGTVRDDEAGRAIAAIDYEAYEPLARKELMRIGRRVEERFGARAAVQHRLGAVPAGEASVLVAAAAAHRAEAFAACRELIDRLKETVPIWKARLLASPAGRRASVEGAERLLAPSPHGGEGARGPRGGGAA